jgi:hypothetical protein
VLLSHDQHPDNLDTLGRAYLAGLPLVLSTASAADRLGGNVRGAAGLDLGRAPPPRGPGPPHHRRARPAWAGRQRAARRGGHRVRPGRPGPAHGVRQRRQRLGGGGPWRRRPGRPGGRGRPVRRGGPDGPGRRGLPDPDQPGRRRSGQAPRSPSRGPAPLRGMGPLHQGRDTLAAAFDRAGLADRLHLPEPGGWVEL